MQILKAVATNIITGALGVGKTTLIKRLLEQKPEHERWAVLINEFGEIGMDAALLQASSNTIKPNSRKTKQHIFVREVPGGCMCCTSGITMQIALNQLLAISKPHRLLIEPTGLGHPKEVKHILGSEYYKDVIKLENTLCLVDARKLANERWRNHQTFKEQFEVADKIVVTKTDLYEGNEFSLLDNYLCGLQLSDTELHHSVKGQINRKLLDKCQTVSLITQAAKKNNSILGRKVGVNEQAKNNIQSLGQSVDSTEQNHEIESDSNDAYILRKEKDNEGFYSVGWRWPADYWFEYAEVVRLIESLDVVRVKAIIITVQGIFSFNVADGEVQIQEHDEALDSQLEFIASAKPSAKQAAKRIENFIQSAFA